METSSVKLASRRGFGTSPFQSEWNVFCVEGSVHLYVFVVGCCDGQNEVDTSLIYPNHTNTQWAYIFNSKFFMRIWPECYGRHVCAVAYATNGRSHSAVII